MSIERKAKSRLRRRVYRVRQRFEGNRPRVSVFRSLRHIYAQIIDDNQQKTIVSASSEGIKPSQKASSKASKDKSSKKDIAYAVGVELAQRALAQGIKEIAFDRGAFRYHGRVKALAEGLKEGGVSF